MKKKIGEIYNKPIVVGNKNEITKNEIHVNEIINASTSGEGGGSASLWKYYDISALDIETKTSLSEVAMMGREPSQGILTYGILLLSNLLDQTDAFSLDINCKILQGGQVVPISVMWEEYESMLLQSGVKEITEEEFYRMPHNVVLEDGASDDIKIVFEDLMSKISSYPSDEKFDSPLSSYGYDSISFGGNSFTRVGKYSLNVFGGRDIIYLMISEGDNPENGWGLYRDNTVSPKEYGLNYPG